MRLFVLALIAVVVGLFLRERLKTSTAFDGLAGLAVRGLQDALYAKNLGKPGDPELALEYKRVNDAHFGGKLPAIPVNWEPEINKAAVGAGVQRGLDGLWAARGDSARIFLNPALKKDAREFRRALCHEMVHEWVFTLGDTQTNHGPRFRGMLQRLADEGAFDGILVEPAEKAALKAELERDQASLAEDKAFLESMTDAALHNAQLRGYNDKIAGFNERAERYNRMMTFPDDGESYAAGASPTEK